MRLVTGLFFTLLLAACTFTLDEPSGITSEITPVTPTGSISLEDYIDEDTIFLYTSKTFTFDVINNTTGSQVAGEAYFNNNVFYTFASRHGQFYIPDSYFKTGTHKLKLTFKEPLNDQSLISQFKDRQAIIFKEWVVIIDVDPPSAFEITTSVENGFVKYSWPEYKRAGFINYGLRVNPGHGYRTLTVTDPTKNVYVDSTYIDGNEEGTINVTIATIHGSVEAYAIVNEPPIKLSMEFRPEDTTASLIWSKPKYYGALKSYTISDQLTTLANLTTPTDTTLILKIDGAFPNVTQLRFKMMDLSGREVFTAEKDIDFFTGNAMPPSSYGQFWYYSQQANKFLGRTGGKINIYDASFNLLTSRTIEGNAFYGLTVAWPGTYLHYIGSGYTISQLNLVTNAETSMPVPGDLIPAAYVNVVSGANNQVVSFNAIDNDHVHPSKDIVGLADLQTSTVLSQVDDGARTDISDDGRYSVGWPEVYSISGGTQTHVGTIPNNYYFRWFRGDNTDEIITTQYNYPLASIELKTVIVRSSDMQILRSFDPPEAGFFLTCYDPSTKTLLYTKFGATKVYLVNIETGNKKVFKARGSFSTPLVNGIIIIGDRYIKAI